MIALFYSDSPLGEKRSIKRFNSYEHEIERIGGCTSSKFDFFASEMEIEDWFYYGVGRHISAYNQHGNFVWEGIVNRVSSNMGHNSISVGPLVDISNRINIEFQYPNYGVEGDPLAGNTDEVPGPSKDKDYYIDGWANNWESQSRYGVLMERVSGGASELEPMMHLLEKTLVKLSEPQVSTDYSIQPNPELSVSVECIGYSQLLKKQVYNNQWVEGRDNIDLSVKIQQIMEANDYFVGERAPDFGLQDVNIITRPEEEENRTSWDIISEHLEANPNEADVLWGFFPGMQFDLRLLTDRDVFYRKRGDERLYNQYAAEIVIEPSEFRPGGAMTIYDLSKPITYSIDSVKYNMKDNKLSLNKHTTSLRHLISKWMMG